VTEAQIEKKKMGATRSRLTHDLAGPPEENVFRNALRGSVFLLAPRDRRKTKLLYPEKATRSPCRSDLVLARHRLSRGRLEPASKPEDTR